MSINGVGANGQVVQNIETKKIAKEAGKGSLMGAIGNLLNGSRKAEAMEQPMKGWSLEHTGTGNVSGSVITQTVESKPQTPNKPKEIRQPEFKGLENFNFVPHNAKPGVGAITVNNEQMLLEYNSKDGSYQLDRFVYDPNSEYPTMAKMVSYTIYSSKEELLNALNDKNADFGKYEGLEDIQDVFIP